MLKQIEMDVPRPALAMQVTVAGLAALGLTSLLPVSDGQAPLPLVLVLAALVAAALLVRTRDTVVRARKDAGRASITDPLTGVATGPAGERILELEFGAAQRGRPLTLVLFRVDRFGRYRAQHGRVVADQLLRICGRALLRHQRSMHVAARHPEDPSVFVSILSGVDREGAATYAARVRRRMATPGAAPDPDGISVGIASFDLSMGSPAELIGQAESALDRASEGGGRIVVVGDGAEG